MNFDIRTPSARRTDPETSHLAAEHMTKSGGRMKQAEQVLSMVRRYPNSTTQELAAHGELNRDALSRRLPELETLGHVEKGAARRCTITNRTAHTWHPT